jgi:hypothetical protein
MANLSERQQKLIQKIVVAATGFMFTLIITLISVLVADHVGKGRVRELESTNAWLRLQEIHTSEDITYMWTDEFLEEFALTHLRYGRPNQQWHIR